MSSVYFLVCMDCNRGADLGKPVIVSYGQDLPGTYGFGLLGYTGNGLWQPDRGGCSILQHFLMTHRAHELRVLPQSIGKFEDPDGDAVPASFPGEEDDPDPDYNLTAFFSRDVGDPDPDKEGDRLPQDLIRRVRELSARSDQ